MTPSDLDAIEKRAAHWYNECDACRAKIPMYETAGWHSSAEGWCEEPTPCETQIAADLRALPAEVRRLRAALENVAERELSDGSLCWCRNHDERGPYAGQHDDDCTMARSLLPRIGVR